MPIADSSIDDRLYISNSAEFIPRYIIYLVSSHSFE
jgi:hypothetical protein